MNRTRTFTQFPLYSAWPLKRAGFLFTQRREKARPDDVQLTASQEYGVISQELYQHLSGNRVTAALAGVDNFLHVSKGDFVISLRAFEGGIEYAFEDGCISPAYTVLRPSREVGSGFFRYLLKSSAFLSVLQTAVTGIRDGKSVRYKDFADLVLPIPDLSVQVRIADFLDCETARIDHVIIAKRRLMTLLEEKRLATITYAVTRGVSRNGVVDPAGGERVDMVPLDWQVIRFRRVIKRIEQGWSPPSENRPVQPGEWGVLKVGCVNRGRFRPEEHKALPPGVEPRPELEVRDGDLLMSRGNTHDLVGSAAIASNTPPRLMLSDLLYRLVLDERVVRPRFAMYALNGYPLRSQIEACASGSSDSMPKISQEKIKELTWAVPPLVEQDAVIAYLDSHLERIDQLLEVIDRSVRCLEEFRSALITAAVTGQIDPDTWHKRGETDRRLEAIEAEVNQ